MRVWPAPYGPGKLFPNKRAGAGAGPPPWTPADKSPGFWLRSGSETTSGGFVDQATDLSGNGRHGVGTTTKRPGYATNRINGLPAWSWADGSLTRLVLASSGYAVPTNGTAYAVAKLTSGKTNFRCMFGGNPATPTPSWFWQNSTNLGACGYWLPTGVINTVSSATNDGVWRVIRWMWGASLVSIAYNNGAAQTISRAGLNPIADSIKTIGEFGDGSHTFDGEIAEVAVFPSEFTAGEILSLNEYLKYRYALWA